MADKNIDTSIDQVDDVATAISDEAETEYQPVYRKYEDAKIPVSKHVGKVWKSRMDQVVAKMKDDGTYDSWDEAIAYYKNDQSGKTQREPETMDTKTGNTRLASTENIVFANVSSLVPAIYAKNPEVNVKTTKRNDEAAEKTALIHQRLITTLMQKRTAPGVNLKPKIRRGVVVSTLTNVSYIETGYVQKEQSSEAELEELSKIADKLATAKKEELKELEGQLLAMDDKIDLLSPSGPWTKFRHPKDVFIDPDASLGDLTDAKWIMIRDVIDTAFLNAVYRKKDEDGKWISIYEPSHILKVSTETGTDISGHDLEINSFSLLNEDKDKGYEQYGYDNEQSFNKAQRTVCYYVWDKATRRVYLYSSLEWNWPIWVWDDPYGLEDFFPLIPLSFHTDPEDQFARGEVSYYLDQQDEINKINHTVVEFRNRMLNKTIVNKRFFAAGTEDAVNAFMKPESKKDVLILDFPPDQDISRGFMGFPVPKEASQFLDKGSIYQSIDRLSSVSATMKGSEFKTNTTNKAIESYESSTETRLDEKIDAIEELIGRIGSNILTMCIQFMPSDQVKELIGEFEGEWTNMSAQEAAASFEMTITGGSSLKPTSKVRKEQAGQLAQMLGQFAAKVPAAFEIALKVLERAYSDEFVITAEDWQYIRQTIQQEQQRGQSTGAGDPASTGAAQNPEAAGANPQGAGQGGAQQVVLALSQALEQAGPEIQQQVAQAIGQGVPLIEIVHKLGQMQSNGQQPATQPQG